MYVVVIVVKIKPLRIFPENQNRKPSGVLYSEENKKNRKNSLISSIFIFINIVTKNYPTVESYCYCY